MMSGKVTHGPRSANSRREAEGGLQEEENRGQLKKGLRFQNGKKSERKQNTQKWEREREWGRKRRAERVAGVHATVLRSSGIPQHRAS